jgi:hypothetical protein
MARFFRTPEQLLPERRRLDAMSRRGLLKGAAVIGSATALIPRASEAKARAKVMPASKIARNRHMAARSTKPGPCFAPAKAVAFDGYTYLFKDDGYNLPNIPDSSPYGFVNYWFNHNFNPDIGDNWQLIIENQFTADDAARYSNGFWITHNNFWPGNAGYPMIALSDSETYNNAIIAYTTQPTLDSDGSWDNMQIAWDLDDLSVPPIDYAYNGIQSGTGDNQPPPLQIEQYGNLTAVPLSDMFYQMGSDYPDQSPSTAYQGGMAQMVAFFNQVEYLDLAATNRFVEYSTKKAQYIGNLGELPFDGLVPSIKLDGGVGDFEQNRGGPAAFSAFGLGMSVPGWSTAETDPY